MRSLTRLDRVDALRALALLPVLVVNLSSFHSPGSSLMLAPAPEGSPFAWWVTWGVTALLMGKGITLLNFLVGYGLTLGRAPERRARRLLNLGLLHGFFLYYGDILFSYALAMLMAMRHRRARLRGVLRRGLFWTSLGLLLMVLIAALTTNGSAEGGFDDEVANAVGLLAWWKANASLYGNGLLVVLFLMLPLTYGITLLGLAAGRLRLLTHRRWQPHWRRLARAALPLLGLNLLVALAVLDDAFGAGLVLNFVMALLSLPSWVSWCLLRPTLPAFLPLAGRNTLSIYLSSSLLIVLLLSGAGLHWAPGSVVAFALSILAWVLLTAVSARAARAGRRLPLEAWMARP